MVSMLWLEVATMAAMVAHIAVCPYTKVEESFNMQAIHDLLYHSHNIEQYDHLEFPGVVPRTFIGPVMVGMASLPYVTVVKLLGLAKIWTQYIVRGILGFTVLMGLFSFNTAVRERCGEGVAKIFLLITVSQFHLLFYMSRTLPNIFALTLVLLALTTWLQQRHGRFVCLAGAAVLVFRAELVLFLGLLLLLDLAARRVTIATLLKTAIPAAIVMLGVSVLVDSFFWGRYLWPEGEVLWYNTVLNKSSDWGTSPFLWYFYSALPRALSCSVLLVPVGLYVSPALRQLVVPGLVFVLLYSALPHKELRFIIYVVPVCNVAAAQAVHTLWINRDKSVLRKLLGWAAVCHVLVNVCSTAVFVYTSHHNYPGGQALYKLHQLEPPHTGVHVHIDVPSAQTGVTRFTQINPNWIYNKTEGLSPGGREMMSYTHLLLGDADSLHHYTDSHTTIHTAIMIINLFLNQIRCYNKTEGLSPGGGEMMSYTHLLLGDADSLHHYTDSHTILHTVEAFHRVEIHKHFPFVHFKFSSKVWLLKKRES